MKTIVSALFLFFAFVLAPMAAEARVDILPRKIVMDDRARSAEITIMNLGDKQGTIRISLISYQQDEEGNYNLLETPLDPAFNPDTAVRISPRQFTLPPNGRQKIRVSVQRPADLPDGEYRFHIKAVSYDTEEEATTEKRNPAPSKGNTLSLKMNIAVAIPIIVRKGTLTHTAKIENVTLLGSSQNQYGKPALQYDIVRTGTGGVMGTVKAFVEAPGKEPIEIATTGNVNVFPEAKKRRLTIPLKGAVLGGSSIRVRYTDDYGDKGVIDEVIVQR